MLDANREIIVMQCNTAQLPYDSCLVTCENGVMINQEGAVSHLLVSGGGLFVGAEVGCFNVNF